MFLVAAFECLLGTGFLIGAAVVPEVQVPFLIVGAVLVGISVPMILVGRSFHRSFIPIKADPFDPRKFAADWDRLPTT